MATDYTIPKEEYRALVDERDKLLDGFHAMQQLYEDELKHALSENAKLRELVADSNEELAKMQRIIDYLYSFAKACGVDAEDMRELGIEAGNGVS